MQLCFLDVSWMSGIVFLSSTVWWIHAFIFSGPIIDAWITNECMSYCLILWSFMDICLPVSLNYHGCMPSCFLELSWMHAFLFPWTIMDACLPVSLIYHGCMPLRFSDLSLMYVIVFLWSIMDLIFHFTSDWCMLQCFLHISWMYSLVFPWSNMNVWGKVFPDLSWM